MRRSPAILISPSTDKQGEEFADASISLSNRYADAIIAAGGLPQIFPATTNRAVIAEAVHRSDGIVLTGGDDIDPKLYAPDLAPELVAKAGPPEPERDEWEKELIAETLAQGKPLFGICRGLQILNVALGGTLVVDIPTQVPNALDHRRMDRKMEPVHDVEVVPGSLLARLTGLEKFGVNSTHHQSVGEVAPQLRVVAKSSDGIVEAAELKEPDGPAFLLAVQFHPERLIDKSGIFLQVFKGFVQACASAREKKL